MNNFFLIAILGVLPLETVAERLLISSINESSVLLVNKELSDNTYEIDSLEGAGIDKNIYPFYRPNKSPGQNVLVIPEGSGIIQNNKWIVTNANILEITYSLTPIRITRLPNYKYEYVFQNNILEVQDSLINSAISVVRATLYSADLLNEKNIASGNILQIKNIRSVIKNDKGEVDLLTTRGRYFQISAIDLGLSGTGKKGARYSWDVSNNKVEIENYHVADHNTYQIESPWLASTHIRLTDTDNSDEYFWGDYTLNVNSNSFRIKNEVGNSTQQIFIAGGAYVRAIGTSKNGVGSQFNLKAEGNSLELNGGDYAVKFSIKDKTSGNLQEYSAPVFITPGVIVDMMRDKSTADLTEKTSVNIRSTNNKLILKGQITGLEKADIFGGGVVTQMNSSSLLQNYYEVNGYYQNNILEFGSQPIHANLVQQFQKYQFKVDSNQFTADGNTILLNVKKAYIQDAEFSVLSIAAGKTLVSGDKVTLLKYGNNDAGLIHPGEDAEIETIANGTTGNGRLQKIRQGITYKYLVNIAQNEEGKKVVATIVSSDFSPEKEPSGGPIEGPEVESNLSFLGQSRLAALMTVRDANDLIYDHILGIANENRYKVSPFVMMEAGRNKYRADATLRNNIFNGVLGADFHLDHLHLGAYAEVGVGDYKVKDRFDSAEVNAHGKSRYRGIGIFGKYYFEDFHVDASLRFGRTNTNFHTDDLIETQLIHFKTKANYFGGQLGGGYRHQISDNETIALSAHYLFVDLQGKNVEVANDEIFHFKKSQSQRIRLKADYNYQLTPEISLSGGFAYEYEMKGKSNTVALQKHDLDEVSVKGGTAIFEVGASAQANPSMPLFIDAKVRGFVGKRQGATGILQIRYQF